MSDAFLESIESPQPLEIVVETVEDISAIRDRAKTLVTRISDDFWELSEICSRILDQKLYKNFGFTTFEEYIHKELDMKKSKAYGLAKIHNFFARDLLELVPAGDILFIQSGIKEISWNKALLIAQTRIINEDNAQDVISQAKELSLDQFDMAIKTSIKSDEPRKTRRGADPEQNTMKSFKRVFNFSLVEADKVERAIKEMLMDMPADTNENTALVKICEHFSSSGGGKLEDLFTHIENRFGVSIVAFDKDYDDTLYGEGTLHEYLDERGLTLPADKPVSSEEPPL